MQLNRIHKGIVLQVGQESVWDYPRPPRLEPCGLRIRVVHASVLIAETTRALRVLETSHPPVYYLPPADVATQFLRPVPGNKSYCEFKGDAGYWDLVLTGKVQTVRAAAWSYEYPSAEYAPLAKYLAFYATRVDECWVGDERVEPQQGDFYGGWITSGVVGPFKGAPGTMGW